MQSFIHFIFYIGLPFARFFLLPSRDMTKKRSLKRHKSSKQQPILPESLKRLVLKQKQDTLVRHYCPLRQQKSNKKKILIIKLAVKTLLSRERASLVEYACKYEICPLYLTVHGSKKFGWRLKLTTDRQTDRTKQYCPDHLMGPPSTTNSFEKAMGCFQRTWAVRFLWAIVIIEGQVHYCDHAMSVVNFSHFWLLLWNHWMEFNETLQEARS